jgi:glutathione synthase/RimK-type ligase-like ATP-grasp enzyme/tetratricopeptide (TPR) repeat protein
VVRVTKVPNDGNSASRDQALALFRAGKIIESVEMYKTLLAAEPADADLLGFLSMAQLRLGEEKTALANWRKAVDLETTVPGKLRIIAIFALAMQQEDDISVQPGHKARALDFLAGFAIPDWPGDLPLDKKNQAVVIALAQCLVGFDRKEAALRLLNSALAVSSGDIDFIVDAAGILIEAGNAKQACDLLQPLTTGPQRENGALLIAHAAAAQAAGHSDEAKRLNQRAYEAVPVYMSDRMPGQRMLIGVLNSIPGLITKPQTPFALHFSLNTPATLASKMNDEFRFLSIFPQMASTAKALAALPPPQIIINNWANAEILSKAGVLEFISGYAERFGVPVINHPRRVSVTTRQHNAERLVGIPDLIVPRILRLINQPEKHELIVRVVAEKIGFPVVVRNPFGQVGWETAKIDTAGDLRAYLASVRHPQLYAIEYIHNSLPDGAYRKIRAAVIGGELFMLHVHFGAQWNVHRAKDRRGLAGFDVDGTASAFAQELLRRPEETLGKPAMDALREIRNRTPLDIYGIDFNLMPDGRILFFEANAAMHISMREREDLLETRMAMRDAYRRLFANPPRRP